MKEDFKLEGQNLIKGNLPTNLCCPAEILAESIIRITFKFDFKPVQKDLFYIIFSYIDNISKYEYKQDLQGIKIQVRADDRHNFLVITDRGELVWAIYDDEEFWQEQFKEWEYIDEELKDSLEQFINRFINQDI